MLTNVAVQKEIIEKKALIVKKYLDVQMELNGANAQRINHYIVQRVS